MCMTRGHRWLPILVSAALIVACGDESTGPSDPTTPPAVASVDVEPQTADLTPGSTVQLAATPRSTAGLPLSGRTVSWTTTDSLVATVTGNGLVRGVGTGTAKIRAQAEGRWAEATIRVAEELSSPTLSALSPTSIPVRSAGVTIVLTGSNFAPNAQILWGGSVRGAQWISSTELRLTLAGGQLLTEGLVQVAVRNPDGAETGTLSFLIGPPAVARVDVSPTSVTVPVGSHVQLTATAYDADNTVLLGRTFTWSSVSSATASVDDTGLVTGHHVGATAVIVESEGRWISVPVSVLTPVAYVVLNPNPTAVLVGLGTQLEVATLDASGVPLPGRSVTWWSEAPSLATVDTAGWVQGLAKGTTRIFAESEGKSAWSVVEVRQYASGPVQPYEFRGVAGSIVTYPVDTTTWVDQQGVGHNATLFIADGLLNVDGQHSTYEQVFDLDVVVAGMGIVSQVTWTDNGTYWYDAFNGSMNFESSVNSATFTAVSGGPGELRVEQTIGIAPTLFYRWVVK